MGDLALDVERLIAASAAEKRTQAQEGRNLSPETPSQEHAICISECSEIGKTSVEFDGAVAEPNSTRCPGEVLKKGGIECRICQEEDDLSNLETPCACSGTVKYAHRKCVQRWCNEKGDTMCEICHQPYQSGYTAPPRPVHADGIPGELSGEWRISGAHQLDLIDPRILTIAAAERQFLEAEYDEYASANASGAACCRSAALILMALLLLRHALAMAAAGANGGDTSTFFTLFLLRVAGFMLPCYIMARAMNILQRRRQRQGAIAAAEMALLLQGAQARGTLRFSVAPGNPSVNDSA